MVTVNLISIERDLTMNPVAARVRVDEPIAQPTPAQQFARCPAVPAPAAASAAAIECGRLLQATSAGDATAFSALYQLTSARLFAVVRRIVWSRAEAEEVLQEVYLKIWRHAAAFDATQAQPLSWMTRIARNHSIDHLRRAASRIAHEQQIDRAGGDDDADPRADHAGIDPSPRPEEWLEQRDDERRFDQLMNGLSPIQRQVLVMSFREGCTQVDIAARLDAPLGTVKSWMRRALQQLKAAIDQQDQTNHGANA